MGGGAAAGEQVAAGDRVIVDGGHGVVYVRPADDVADAVSSLVYFDLNGLKPVNDSYGHAAGDAVIAYVARVLVQNVRDSDVVGRLGGDEFAVILPGAGANVAEGAAGARSSVWPYLEVGP